MDHVSTLLYPISLLSGWWDRMIITEIQISSSWATNWDYVVVIKRSKEEKPQNQSWSECFAHPESACRLAMVLPRGISQAAEAENLFSQICAWFSIRNLNHIWTETFNCNGVQILGFCMSLCLCFGLNVFDVFVSSSEIYLLVYQNVFTGSL